MSNLEVTPKFKKFMESHHEMSLGTFLFRTKLYIYEYVKTADIQPSWANEYDIFDVVEIRKFRSDALDLDEYAGVPGYWLNLGWFNEFRWFVPKSRISELFTWRSHPTLLSTPAYHFVNYYFQIDEDGYRVSAKAEGTHLIERDNIQNTANIIRMILSKGANQ